ncbi:MAG: ABC transporter permease [Methanomicrobiales archaeon]|nr:ABC transporter permease [Methanomicrobiales archaeon]
MIFFEFAKRNIRLHWLRSLLAVIGITIGVVAITSMGILGNSLVLSISNTLTSVGDTIVITPHTSFQNFGGGSSTSGISERDVEQIRRSSGSNAVIPVYAGGDRIAIGRDVGAATIYGLDPKDIPLLLEVVNGTYIRSSSGVMVGSRIAEEFNLKLGSQITIGSDDATAVRVVGILKERGVGFDINPDFGIIASDQWFSERYGVSSYDQVIVKVKNLDEIDRVKSAIEEKLNRRETTVNVLDTRAILEGILSAFNQIKIFTTAIGGISLIVAGVSIFNVMMMSVTERTKEIGVIRSIGTQKSEVLKMFLDEAIILGLIGSLVGGVLSFAGGYAVSQIMLQTTEYLFVPSSLINILYGMLFGVVTSLLSGIYPAWKAANLNPIEALRHE